MIDNLASIIGSLILKRMKFDTTNNLPLTTAPQKISLRETEKIKANPVEIRKGIVDYLSAAGTLLRNSLLK